MLARDPHIGGAGLCAARFLAEGVGELAKLGAFEPGLLKCLKHFGHDRVELDVALHGQVCVAQACSAVCVFAVPYFAGGSAQEKFVAAAPQGQTRFLTTPFGRIGDL